MGLKIALKKVVRNEKKNSNSLFNCCHFFCIGSDYCMVYDAKKDLLVSDRNLYRLFECRLFQGHPCLVQILYDYKIV